MEQAHTDLINKVITHVLEKLPAQDASVVEALIRQYYTHMAPEELASRSVLDLYGAMLSHWQYIKARQPKEPHVRVYNPQFEQHGWQTTHTVVEVVYEDVPFLIDSIRMELNRRGFAIHCMMHLGGKKLLRDASGKLELLSNGAADANHSGEVPLYIEIDKQTNPAVLVDLTHTLGRILTDVDTIVQDWSKMTQKLAEVMQEVTTYPQVETEEGVGDKQEVLAFLSWLKENHFTFLAYQYLTLSDSAEGPMIQADPTLSLGMEIQGDHKARLLNQYPEQAKMVALSPNILLLLGKTSTMSTIHRPTYTDFVSIKRFKDGKVIGEHRFIGLYTAAAYHSSPRHIPLLRCKIKNILKLAGLTEKGHEGKDLINILETLPRDDLFQASEQELYILAIGILQLQERQRVRFFVRSDLYCRFYSCLVYIPRERFNSELREKMQNILMSNLHGSSVTFETRFSESVLARVHFIVRTSPHHWMDFDVADIERQLVEAFRSWQDDLHLALIDGFGEEKGNDLFQKYQNAFPVAYINDFMARHAVYDIQHIESLNTEKPLSMTFYRSLEDQSLRFKIFQPKNPIPLSDIIPMLEFMGLKVIHERPYQVLLADGMTVWINDFRMTLDAGGETLDVEKVKDKFQDVFFQVWHGRMESDGFNRLVLRAGLSWQTITMFRAYAKHFWQTGFTFTQSYVENTLAHYPTITEALAHLFMSRFNPTLSEETRKQGQADCLALIQSELDKVANLDEDRILRRYKDTILATIRTTYFQMDANGKEKNYLAFKFDPKAIPDLPLPRPMFEIFVYSPRVEGVHLRAAKVARGGLRWSDRREDFRTEVLGLMKAQQVKNAVIVPMGAKGGFYPKLLSSCLGREAIMAEAIACYQMFISALLDLTDNLVHGEIDPPKHLVAYDEPDPYLVVAADKGTATFSDIANKISLDRNFWLKDAFASGGSVGYDHKKMGITAKGAWESVKRHFQELGINPEETDFTAIGIGDLSGDVFGNGLLLSQHYKMVAAFNHMHIFLDPDPDPSASFRERKRLFDLPRSAWSDYDVTLISKGGGVFLRSAKSIPITPQVRKVLGLKKDVESMEPNALIQAILKAPVDLLWNGGIGTYVKSSRETHSDVGDRTNDGVRINGKDLHCKIVAEGGNLGMTQLGRIEYALLGGRLNTDSIDNSAGVDCSDHEVNIKILLNNVMESGELTEKQRLELLAQMTDEVSTLVLQDNRSQNEAISLAEANASINLDMHYRMIQALEREGKLDRAIEFLPDRDAVEARRQSGKGLTRPELSVLLSYAKNILQEGILLTDLPEDPYLLEMVALAFPHVLKEKYGAFMQQHRLRREIIATQLSNCIVNEMGINFIQRLQDETGVLVADIIRAYMSTREIFEVVELRNAINNLGVQVPFAVQIEMLSEVNRFARRITRWLVCNRPGQEIEKTIQSLKPGVLHIIAGIRHAVSGVAQDTMETTAKGYIEAGVPEGLAYQVASLFAMFSAPDIVEAAVEGSVNVDKVMQLYFLLSTRLKLGWYREQIKAHPVRHHWDSLARAALRDDLDKYQRNLTLHVLRQNASQEDLQHKVDNWVLHNAKVIERWQRLTAELKASTQKEFIMFAVALRELIEMMHTT